MTNVYLIAASGCVVAVSALACLALWMAYRRVEKYAALYQQTREHGSVTFHNLQVLREAAESHVENPTAKTELRLKAVLKDL